MNHRGTEGTENRNESIEQKAARVAKNEEDVGTLVTASLR